MRLLLRISNQRILRMNAVAAPIKVGRSKGQKCTKHLRSCIKDYWGIEVGIFNDDATPVSEALSSSILESDDRADLAV